MCVHVWHGGYSVVGGSENSHSNGKTYLEEEQNLWLERKRKGSKLYESPDIVAADIALTFLLDIWNSDLTRPTSDSVLSQKKNLLWTIQMLVLLEQQVSNVTDYEQEILSTNG